MLTNPNPNPNPNPNQDAWFNQPLSFDTSSVTDMEYMFDVCSPRPSAGPFPARSLRNPRAHNVRPLTYCPPVPATRQYTFFNQPLGIDTSSVTTMSYMFAVRALASTRLPFLCMRLALPRAHCLPSQHLTCTPHVPARAALQNNDEFNQPLSFDTRRVTDMSWMFYVRALASTSSRDPSLRAQSLRSPRANTARPLTS